MTEDEFAELDRHSQTCSRTAMLGCQTCMRYADAAMDRLRESQRARHEQMLSKFMKEPRTRSDATNDTTRTVRKALDVLRPPMTVCSDLPMYGLMNRDKYRVVCSANQNNIQHFGPSERWAGIPDDGAAFALAAIVNAAPELLVAVEALTADLDRLCGPVCVRIAELEHEVSVYLKRIDEAQARMSNLESDKTVRDLKLAEIERTAICIRQYGQELAARNAADQILAIIRTEEKS